MSLGYGLEAFARDLEAIVVARQHDLGALVAEAAPLLARLLGDMSWLEPRYRALEQGPAAERVVYEHPEGAYVILSMVFGPGCHTEIHDHNSWGIVGVWDGAEREERYTQVDDGAREDHAELRLRADTLNIPGTVTTLVPPADDIHRLRNDTAVSAHSIHIYGPLLDRRGTRVFDLATGAVRRWSPPVGYQDLLAMLQRGAERRTAHRTPLHAAQR